MVIPRTVPADYATLFARERAHLLTLLQGLDAQQWSSPTPCPGWDVLGLTCHLVSDDLGVLARQRDDHIRPVGPDPTVDGEQFIRWLDALQQQWVAAARRLSPRLAVDLLAWTGPQVVDLFRSQDVMAVDAAVSWASTDLVPRWLDQARELTEHWLHRQQLLDALGRRDEPPDRTLLAAVLDALRWAYPHGLRNVGRAGDVMRVRIRGDVDADWWIARRADGWEFTGAAASAPAATAALRADEAWRMLSNNLPASRQDALDLSGRPELVTAFRRTRGIIGLPH